MENFTPEVETKLGQIVEINSDRYVGQKWKIVGDDNHSKALKKEWDYVLQNVETGEVKTVFASKIKFL